MKVVVGVSNRHVHVTKNAWNKLFGDKEMEVRNFLNQPGQFASTSTVDIKIDNLFLEHLIWSRRKSARPHGGWESLKQW